MKYIKGNSKHECAPKEWRTTPDYTGCYTLDACIHRNTNKDLPHRLAYFLEQENAYGARTGYDGYHNYGGDS